MESVEARRLFAAVTWDGGANSSNWTDPLNWSNNQVPQSGDDVTIGINAGTIKVNSGVQSVNSLISGSKLLIDNNATLSVAAASELNGGLDLLSGTLGGSGAVTVREATTWDSGGNIAGPESVSFLGNVTLLGNASNANLTVGGATVVKFFGQDNVASGAVSRLVLGGTSRLELLEGAELAVRDGFDLLASVNNSTSAVYLGEQATIVNRDANELEISLKLYSDEISGVVAEQGTVKLTGGGNYWGSLVTHAGATLKFASQSAFYMGWYGAVEGAGNVEFVTGWSSPLTLDCDFDVTGKVTFAGRTITFGSHATLTNIGATRVLELGGSDITFDTGEAVTLDGAVLKLGAIGGGDAIAVAGAATIEAGVTLKGSGVLTLNGPASFDINKGTGIQITDTRRVVVNGEATYGGANVAANFYALSLNGGAAFEIGQGGRLTTRDNGYVVGTWTSAFVNNGTLVVESTGFTGFSAPYSGTGSIELRAGETQFGTFTLAGTMTVDAGAKFTASHDAQVFAEGSLVHGEGAFTFGNANFRGSLDVGGVVRSFTGQSFFHPTATVVRLGSAFEAHGGTIHFNTGKAIPVAALDLRNGSRITGADAVVVSGATFWGRTAGMAGTGTTELNGPVTIDFVGVNAEPYIVESRLVKFNGNVTLGSAAFSNSFFNVGGSSRIELAAGKSLTLVGDADLRSAYRDNGAPAIAFTNYGDVVRSDASGSSTLGVSFNNQGAIRVFYGAQLEVNLPANATLTGKWNVGGQITSTNFAATNDADILFYDESSAFTALARITRNNGKIRLEDGADLMINPGGNGGTFTNAGLLAAYPTSVLTVQGSLAQADGSIDGLGARYRFTVSGDAPDQIGQLVVTGTANLASPTFNANAHIVFHPDFEYDPAPGKRFDLITAGSVVGQLDSVTSQPTPSGHTMEGGQDATHVFATVAAPVPPPQVEAVTFDHLTRQALVLKFNVDVDLLRQDLVIVNRTTNQALPAAAGTFVYDADTRTATLTLTGLLADGNYRLTLAASAVKNADDVAMAAPVSFDFFVLAGDANRDRHVDAADLAVFNANLGDSDATLGEGDFNYDGIVNGLDADVLEANARLWLPEQGQTVWLAATDGSDAYQLRQEAGGRLAVWTGAGDDASLSYRFLTGAASSIFFEGAGGADSLLLAGLADAADSVVLEAGAVDFGGLFINHSGLETVAFDGHGGWDSVSLLAGTTLTLQGTQQLATFNIAAGSRATVAADGSATLFTRADGLAVAGTLDLTDNDLAIDYAAGGASPIGAPTGGTYSGLTGLIQSGYNGGAWDGVGIITSTSSAATGLTTLAIGEAGEILGITDGQTILWNGQAIDASTVIVKFTYGGDTNFDGKLDADDYGTIDFSTLVPGSFGYAAGDFNFDGKVDADDYGVIDFNILAQDGVL